MSIADEIAKLDDLRQRGIITEAEFQQAKDSLLEGSRMDSMLPPDQAMSQQLALVEFQNQLALMDREWELEREKYMITGRYGHRSIPTRGASMAGGMMVVGFGALWTMMAIGIGNFGSGMMEGQAEDGLFSTLQVVFPLFGVLFMAFGGYMSYFAYHKASEHEKALEEFQRRRAAFVAEFEARVKQDLPVRTD